MVTLWYRAPELLLGAPTYGPAVDLWSVGCIFAEMLTRKPLFGAARTETELLDCIWHLLGTPTEANWPGWSTLPGAGAAGRSKPRAATPLRPALGLTGSTSGVTFVSDAGLDLLRRLLCLDPASRITAEEALRHPWFEESPRVVDSRLLPSAPSAHDLELARKRGEGGEGRKE